MILKVNPTRINLLGLKKELKTASQGHKLLKDKRDGLMQVFLTSIKELKELKSGFDPKVSNALKSYFQGISTMPQAAISNALYQEEELEVEIENKTTMSVPLPSFHINRPKNIINYGFSTTSGDLDLAILKIDELVEDMVKIAELQKKIENLAVEIEKTRRRASVLENTIIPDLKDTIKFIQMRLDEQARDATVTTMRIKSMIEENKEI